MALGAGVGAGLSCGGFRPQGPHASQAEALVPRAVPATQAVALGPRACAGLEQRAFENGSWKEMKAREH